MKVNRAKIMTRLTVLGLSMDQLVRRSSISKYRISDIMNGSDCDSDEMYRISRALATRSEELT